MASDSQAYIHLWRILLTSSLLNINYPQDTVLSAGGVIRWHRLFCLQLL